MAKQPSQGSTRVGRPAAEDLGEGDGAAADLSYSQARTALELVLAELQAGDLDVEAMAGLYRRGQAYIRRCESILEQVEQEILVWDGLQDPDAPPRPAENISPGSD
jgi:exodeoxyribonuclease VII small subunit